MADVADDIRPVAELLDTLRSEGVRADNRDRLRRQLEVVQAALKRFPNRGSQSELSQEALDKVREQLRFAQEARQILEESIVAAETFVTMQLALDHPARPVEGEADYAELVRDTIARFPRILAALAK